MIMMRKVMFSDIDGHHNLIIEKCQLKSNEKIVISDQLRKG